MIYDKFNSDKLYIVTHLTGFGEQGGEPIRRHEIVHETDDLRDAEETGAKMFPRDPSGWTYHGYSIDINLNHPVGQKLYEGFCVEADKRMKFAEEHPELYTKFEMDGKIVYMQKIKEFDEIKTKDSPLESYRMVFLDTKK